MITVSQVLENPTEYLGESITIEGNIYHAFVQSSYGPTYSLSPITYVSDQSTDALNVKQTIIISDNIYETNPNSIQRHGVYEFVEMLVRIPRPEAYLKDIANKIAPKQLQPIYRKIGRCSLTGTLATSKEVPGQYILIDLTEATYYGENHTALLNVNEKPLSEIISSNVPSSIDFDDLNADIGQFIGRTVSIFGRLRGIGSWSDPRLYLFDGSVFDQSKSIELKQSWITQRIATHLDIAVGGNASHTGHIYITGKLVESHIDGVLATMIDFKTVYIAQDRMIYHWSFSREN